MTCWISWIACVSSLSASYFLGNILLWRTAGASLEIGPKGRWLPSGKAMFVMNKMKAHPMVGKRPAWIILDRCILTGGGFNYPTGEVILP